MSCLRRHAFLLHSKSCIDVLNAATDQSDFDAQSQSRDAARDRDEPIDRDQLLPKPDLSIIIFTELHIRHLRQLDF